MRNFASEIQSKFMTFDKARIFVCRSVYAYFSQIVNFVEVKIFTLLFADKYIHISVHYDHYHY